MVPWWKVSRGPAALLEGILGARVLLEGFGGDGLFGPPGLAGAGAVLWSLLLGGYCRILMCWELSSMMCFAFIDVMAVLGNLLWHLGFCLVGWCVTLGFHWGCQVSWRLGWYGRVFQGLGR